MTQGKVRHIHHKRDNDVNYKGHTIHIVYRKETNDYAYTFSHTKTLNFDGHASNYDNCLANAKKYVDIVTG